MKVLMGESLQLYDIKGGYQNDKKEVEYETINPVLVEEADYITPISQVNTSTDRYHDQPKTKISNSQKFMYCLLLIVIFISTATLSVFIYILVRGYLPYKAKILCLIF